MKKKIFANLKTMAYVVDPAIRPIRIKTMKAHLRNGLIKSVKLLPDAEG